MDRLIDATYALFKQRVEEGRGLSAAAVARLAKGRVWTGEQALELGLVDALGGLADAVALAKAEAGLPAEEGAVQVKQVYPERTSPLVQALKRALGGEGDREASPAAAPAAWAAALGAAALGQQLSLAEVALLQQLGASAGLAPQCVALDAERLATSL